MTSNPENGVAIYQPFLGREARTGTWEQLARGTFREAIACLHAGRHTEAAELVAVSLLEAQELREIYQTWPTSVIDWLGTQGVSDERIDDAVSRLNTLIGKEAAIGIEAGWPAYAGAAERAIGACRSHQEAAPGFIEAARAAWQQIHDAAVDRVSGMIDISVRLLGEERLVDLWNHLLSDWYEIHAKRYDLRNQPWELSAHQLMVSIVDGFHAHLAGAGRQGDIELVEETDRIGFRFAPCGSGGRSLDPGIAGGFPRAGAPFNFAVTTERHDWAWNKTGVCSYCVHCCLFNELTPIDRLGYPTRVIDAPVWNGGEGPTHCTWWVYRHPSLIPDHIYERVGRKPMRRPAPNI